MSTAPAPSTNRGEITLQPSYFTSSLYVEPLRQDIQTLISVFSEQYLRTPPPPQPFELFKRIWTQQGWCWIHFKVFDARARESFIAVTERLFLERAVATKISLANIVSLFALYTFYLTQPSTTNPALHSIKHIGIPIDHHKFLLSMPHHISEVELRPLRGYVNHTLKVLLDARAFHILPHSSLRPYNPSVLPREIFIPEGQESAVFAALTGVPSMSQNSRLPKKKGRPSKREKMKKAKDALIALEKYVDKNTVPLLPEPPWHMGAGGGAMLSDSQQTTHILVANPPIASRDNYRVHKGQLLDELVPKSQIPSAESFATSETNLGQQAVQRANEAVLERLKIIDEMAAERGLEVGGEGGEKTGLARVERAVRQMHQIGMVAQRGGILALLDGAGIELGHDLQNGNE
ncbi:uncharacterized protein FIBRA_07406 [Fibroporia radiculosa]|uniref:Uncharacterized protein n=1 Tax=Fibroporia radiculosa TaxID=599839 RepID=J4I0M4_9APHY|nr:uncharacterized protein FIBRA_07406 [Fibroporia radiculosa]CCM05197.1 predicted protein [Fibroporia radiculosa]